ncbi:response regulator [Thermodesulfobacteriota bacterium]
MHDETRKTILCVDDEQVVVDVLYNTFINNYKVKTANSGEEALKIFNEEDICLVITDQRMPEMGGTELLAEINEKKPHCKKILMTGYTDIQVAIDAINEGSVDKYFSKPLKGQELTKAVDDLIESYKMDEFFENVIKDAKSIKEKADQGKTVSQLFEQFMDSYLKGICLVGIDERIEYVNRKGLEIIKSNNLDKIKGKDLKEIFLLNENNKSTLHEKYLKKDISPECLDVKLTDGTSSHVVANVTFAKGKNGDRIFGIIFD